VLDLVYDVRQLVEALACVVGVAIDVLGAEVAPLEAVHWTEVTLARAQHNTRAQHHAHEIQRFPPTRP
jgi:hypothetical protein